MSTCLPTRRPWRRTTRSRSSRSTSVASTCRFLIFTLVGVDTLGAVASNGPEGFTWLIVLAVVLLRPVRPADRRAGRGVHRRGRLLRLDQARLGPLRGRGQLRPVLAVEPGLDGRPAVHHRRSRRSTRSSATSATSASTSSRSRSSGSASGRRSCPSAIGKWIPTLGAWARHRAAGFFTFSVILYAFKHGAARAGASAVLAVLHAVHRARAACCSSTSSASSCRARPATR